MLACQGVSATLGDPLCFGGASRLRHYENSVLCVRGRICVRGKKEPKWNARLKMAKEKCWRDLCREVDKDPWGRPYKIVMRKLTRRQAIIGAEIPDRLDTIVSRLFPKDTDDHGRTSQISELTERTPFPEITEKETLEEVNRLPCSKTPGPDGIANEFLKVIIRADTIRITNIFNRCLWEAHYPERWKSSNLVLIQKPRRPLDDPSSYRPICLMDTLGKLFERILVRRLNHYLESTGALESTQYGFRRKKSTMDAIKKLQEIVKDNNAKGHVVGMLALDVSNAFNSAPWGKITHALREMAVPKYLQDIVSAYLSDRKVVYNLQSSEGSPRDLYLALVCGMLCTTDYCSSRYRVGRKLWLLLTT